ncbi:hypothetical protein [Streptacidiphilus sp. EB103A]|uniref:hypothetical protein n=1 Tax=Streptacidiphilus sp. EB103A TaxID=3156275 RepID=UPI003515D9C5
MSPRHRRLVAAAVLAAAALAGCSASHTARTADHKVGGAGATAGAYLHAWLDLPADVRTMCELQTPAMRPDYSTDGGSLAGCVADYTADFTGQDTHRPALTLTVTDEQPVPATATEPAGTGVLATGQRTAEQPFRYALRLVQAGGSWLVAQVAEVDPDRYGHTGDPVAAVLEAS